jgi:predicted nucleotidyltransferase
MSFDAILRGLNDAGVEYVLVGGLAAIAHGSARVTFDVDVCYDPTEPNRARLADRLSAWHAWLRGGAPDLPFVLDGRTLRDVPVLTLVTDEGNLDVMDRVAGIGEYPAVRIASESIVMLDVTVRAVTLDALIAAKRATGRRKDQEALLELEALREMKRRRNR